MKERARSFAAVRAALIQRYQITLTVIVITRALQNVNITSSKMNQFILL